MGMLFKSVGWWPRRRRRLTKETRRRKLSKKMAARPRKIRKSERTSNIMMGLRNMDRSLGFCLGGERWFTVAWWWWVVGMSIVESTMRKVGSEFGIWSEEW